MIKRIRSRNERGYTVLPGITNFAIGTSFMSVITLTSDIGAQDYLVGAIKGQLHQLCPFLQVVDITHHIAPFNFPQAAYLCKSAFPHFPVGTVHFVLVNLFDRKQDYFLFAQHQGQYYCCADNGLLTMILDGRPEQVVALQMCRTTKKDTLAITRLFAEAVVQLHQQIPFAQIGLPLQDIVERNNLQPLIGDDWMEGQIIYIDNFENVVVNITREQFEQQRRERNFQIFFKRDEAITHISDTYAEVPEGRELALFNTAGYLEIAINKGNAAGLFGLQSVNRDISRDHYYQNRLFYQTIRILFL